MASTNKSDFGGLGWIFPLFYTSLVLYLQAMNPLVDAAVGGQLGNTSSDRHSELLTLFSKAIFSQSNMSLWQGFTLSWETG